MGWQHTKKNKNSKKDKIIKKATKKAAKKTFGKSLPLVMILLVLLGLLGTLAYAQFEPFRDFVDGLGIFTEKAPTVSYIDPEGNEMAVHFLDVGQGDATLFQTTAGAVLVDCSESEYADYILEYLDSLGIEELEYFIITHPDSDHMGAAPAILEGIKVNNIVMNGQEKSTKFFENTLDVIEEKNINALIAAPGDVFSVGALQLSILGPQSYLVEDDDWNEASLIIHATYGHRSILLTGDAEDEGEADLVNTYGSVIKCDIFQAGHHGSRTSNSMELLEVADPDIVIISCGEGNKHGHPHSEAIGNFNAIGAEQLITYKEGTIVFVTDGESLERK